MSARDCRLSLPNMLAALERIDPRFLHSPQARCEALSTWLGCELVLKDDSANPLGSFKGRGAHAFVASRVSQGPLVCASAGNFGMALAHAGRRHRVPVTVFVSRHANPSKVEGIRRLGADVRVAGEDFDAAKDAARAFAAAQRTQFVEDGREPAISEGAGTIGIELLAAHPSLDAVVLPLGNGALLAGVGRWIKAHAPGVRVIGVVADGAPAMRDALRAATAALRTTRRAPVAPALQGVPAAEHAARCATPCRAGSPGVSDVADARCDTIADGIAVRVAVPEALLDLAPVLDEVLTVDDGALLLAMQQLHARTRRIAEPSAVAGLAAIHTRRARFAEQRVATVLTGRNVTPAQRAAWFS